MHAGKNNIVGSWDLFHLGSCLRLVYLLTTPLQSMTFSKTVLSLKLDEDPNAAPASVVDSASRKINVFSKFRA